jgi:hypothetical protein
MMREITLTLVTTILFVLKLQNVAIWSTAILPISAFQLYTLYHYLFIFFYFFVNLED